MRTLRTAIVLSSLVLVGVACDDGPVETTPPEAPRATSAEIGPEGGEIIAPEGGDFGGFALKIPAGALKQKVTISFTGVFDETPLPDTAERVGPQIRIEPAGTVLAVPAELTLPLDPTMLRHYEGKPESCKVWVRSGPAWSKVEALRHTLLTVTIPITTFETAAAGVNFVAKKTCTGCVPIPTAPTEPACEALPSSVEYCILDLPQPEITKGLDEFSTLTVVGRKVYWVAIIDSKPTVVVYDLDNPGPVTQFPAYNGPAEGSITARGRVAVLSPTDSVVWAGVGGFGNIRFTMGRDAEVFDRPTPGSQPCGVAAVPGFPRFYRTNVGGTNERFDVRMIGPDGDKFVYNARRYFEVGSTITVAPAESVSGNSVGVASADRFPISSTQRGLGLTFKPDPITLGAGFWGVRFPSIIGGPADVGRDLPPLYITPIGDGPVAMTTFGYAQGSDSQFIRRWAADGSDIGQLRETNRMPNDISVRSLDFRNGGELFAVSSGRRELYIFSGNNGLKTVALPDEGELSPWRIASVPRKTGTERDMLLVSRGPLVKKGRFSLIRRK